MINGFRGIFIHLFGFLCRRWAVPELGADRQDRVGSAGRGWWGVWIWWGMGKEKGSEARSPKPDKGSPSPKPEPEY